jgi:hypothetical protein
MSNGNYSLGNASSYRNAGSDGRDVGVDWNVLTQATAGSASGLSAPTGVRFTS